MTEELTPDVEQVWRLVQDEVQQLVEQGYASLPLLPAVTDGEPLYQRGPLIELVPSNPDAAPISIMIGADELNVSFGKFLQADLSARREDREEMLEEMIGYVRAVIRGDLKETVWAVRGDEAFKAKGAMTVNDVPATIYWRSGFGFLRPTVKYERRYAPYWSSND